MDSYGDVGEEGRVAVNCEETQLFLNTLYIIWFFDKVIYFFFWKFRSKFFFFSISVGGKKAFWTCGPTRTGASPTARPSATPTPLSSTSSHLVYSTEFQGQVGQGITAIVLYVYIYWYNSHWTLLLMRRNKFKRPIDADHNTSVLYRTNPMNRMVI